MKKGLLTLAVPMVLAGQLHYSGSIHPYGLYRISDGSEISLPFRLAKLDLGYSFGDFDIRTRSALEYRWSSGSQKFDLREATLLWYPDFGEVRVGRQIHAWGAADGNNPTDNLNAYDFYYLFLPGTDRKIGSLSVAVKAYWAGWQIEMVAIPVHKPNRLTYGEKDFPIEPPVEPDTFEKIDHPLEYGLRIQTSFPSGDVAASYFRGHDRGFSLLGLDWGYGGNPVMHFGYQPTDVIGLDVVSFVGELTLRGEAGYFRTSNDYDRMWAVKLNTESDYVQYVVQVEYAGPYDIQFTGQLIGNSVRRVKGIALDLLSQRIVPLTKENFVPGMGTPFAMFIDRAAWLSATGSLMDDRLELAASALMDLVEKGVMVSVRGDYSPVENWEVEFALTEFVGTGSTRERSIFDELEDFSHVQLGLKFSF
ncbi:MAG: hypothetical protein ACE5GH_02280 [Fidelibacterota bacterium]